MIHTSPVISQFATPPAHRHSQPAMLDRSLHGSDTKRSSDRVLMKRQKLGSRGQIMVILALAMVGVVGIAALGIDVFYIYWNKNRLQSGTDAAALAGATYLNGVTFAGKNVSCIYSTDAQNAACSYALNDGVLLSELTSVVANTSNQSMTVSATRQVSALFARV